MTKYRTHNCSELDENAINQDVCLWDGCIEKEIMEICYL